MRVVDLLTVVQRQVTDAIAMPTRIENVDENLWVKVDSFAVAQAIASLAVRLHADYGIRELRFRATASGRFAEVDLVWTGAIVGSEALAMWETETMRIGADETPLTLKDVLERHGGEVWSQADRPRQKAWFRILLPLGEPVAAATPRPSAADDRPEYYDFDLFEHIETTARWPNAASRSFPTRIRFRDHRPRALGGDEIISISAVHIINGRLLKRGVRSVDQSAAPDRARGDTHPRHRQPGPRRPAADRPGSACVSTASARARVLVAHNAAFDMRFLELRRRDRLALRPAGARYAAALGVPCTRASRPTTSTRSPHGSACA